MLWIGMLLFLLGVGVEAQVPSLGACPSVETVEDFEPARYMGKWFEAARYFTVFQLGGKCVSANYTLTEKGTVLVHNSQISSITGDETSIDGFATPVGSANIAKLTVVFPSLPFQFGAPYWVVGTDYDNWAVVFSCLDASVVSGQASWILTRARNATDSVLKKAYEAIDRNNLSRSSYHKTDQTHCSASD